MNLVVLMNGTQSFQKVPTISGDVNLSIGEASIVFDGDMPHYIRSSLDIPNMSIPFETLYKVPNLGRFYSGSLELNGLPYMYHDLIHDKLIGSVFKYEYRGNSLFLPDLDTYDMPPFNADRDKDLIEAISMEKRCQLVKDTYIAKAEKLNDLKRRMQEVNSLLVDETLEEDKRSELQKDFNKLQSESKKLSDAGRDILDQLYLKKILNRKKSNTIHSREVNK